MKAHLLLSLSLSLLLSFSATAATTAEPKPDRLTTYKTANGLELKLHVFEPMGLQPSDRRPAIVFFFGGGWNSGEAKQFYQQARALADQGMVAFSADYRVKSRNQTTPFECVLDGKSAIRWVRQHAAALGVDPERIAAAGGSAGGHVAASAACLAEKTGKPEFGQDVIKALKDGAWMVLVESLEDGVALVNAFAPEHLSLIVRNENAVVPLITTSGAIFLGNDSPVAVGDFLAGPSHELPTGGAGKSFPGLTVDMFQRRTSIVRLDHASVRKSLAVVEDFARIEGLDAHGRSTAIR
jgi:hypothetical protein